MTEEQKEKERLRKKKWYQENKERLRKRNNLRYQTDENYREKKRATGRNNYRKLSEAKKKERSDYVKRYRMGLIPGTKTYKEW